MFSQPIQCPQENLWTVLFQFNILKSTPVPTPFPVAESSSVSIQVIFSVSVPVILMHYLQFQLLIQF